MVDCSRSRLIVVDQDDLSNFICLKIIQSVAPGLPVAVFTDTDSGFTFLNTLLGDDAVDFVIVLINMHMEEFSGWILLDQLSVIDAALRVKLKIYSFSSTVFTSRIEWHNEHPFISGYLSKPLTAAKIEKIVYSWNFNDLG